MNTEVDYDQESMPFKGCEVLQKFNNNASYTKRYKVRYSLVLLIFSPADLYGSTAVPGQFICRST